MLKIGDLFAELHLEKKSFEAGAASAHKMFGGLANEAKKAALAVVGIATAAAAAFLAFGHAAAKNAEQQERANARVKATYGDGAKAVDDWSNRTARAVGVNNDVLAISVAKYGDWAKHVGMAQKDATASGEAMSKRAADIALATGKSYDEIFDKLFKGQQGMTRGLKEYGVVIDPVVIKQEALKEGLITSTQKVDAATASRVRGNLIMQQTAQYTGIAAGMQDSMALKTRQMGEVVDEIMDMVGKVFLGIAVAVLPHVLTAFRGVADWIKANMPTIQKIVTSVFNAMGTVIGFLSKDVIPNLVKIFTWVATNVVPVVAAGFAHVFKVVGELAKGIQAFMPTLQGIGKVLWNVAVAIMPVVSAAAGTMGKILGTVIDGVVKAFQFVGGVIDGVVKGIFGSWSGLATFMGNVWAGITNAVKTGVNVLIDMINTLIDGLNSIQFHIDLGPAGKVDFNGLNLGKLGRMTMDAAPAPGATPKPVSGSPDDPIAAEKEARRNAAQAQVPTPPPATTTSPPFNWGASTVPVIPGSGSAGSKAKEEAKKNAQDAKDALSAAYDKMKDKAHQYFDAVHNQTLKSIQDARDAANKILDAQIAQINGALSAAREALAAQRAARELASLQADVANAQTPEDQARAQQALSDFMAQQAIDAQEKQASIQIDALNAQKQANDDKAAADTQTEDQRYAAQVKAFDKGLALLEDNLKKGRVSYQKANQEVLDMLNGAGVDFKTAGELLGKSFVKGLESQIKAVEAAAKKLQKALEKSGIKISDIGPVPDTSNVGGPSVPPPTPPAVPVVAGADSAMPAAAAGALPASTGGSPVVHATFTANGVQDPVQFVKDSMQALKREVVRQGIVLS